MRLDKFLKVSRLIKRRTVANEACDAGRVLVNGNVAGINYVYDDYGNEIERSFFNTKGEPCLLSNTYHKVVYTYDNNGNLSKERYYDLKNNLTLNSDGLAGYNYVRDERGNVLENTPIGTDEKLKDGWLISKSKYDKFDNVIEYSLKLDSNPAFTSSVIVAYARAVYRMNSEGMSGCKTVFDIPPAYLSAKSGEELRKEML